MAGISIEDLLKKEKEQGAEQSPVPNTTLDPVSSYFSRTSSEQPQTYPEPNYTKPVQNYTAAYAPATTTPQNVQQATDQFSQVNIATQEYANEMQSRIVRDYYGYQTDPEYQGMLSKTYTEQSYDYLKRKNKGANDTAWTEPKPEDDFFSDWLPRWIKDQDMRRQALEEYEQPTPTDYSSDEAIEQSALANMTTDTQREIMQSRDIEHGNWHLMNWWDKAKYLLIPGSSPYTVDEAPLWTTKVIQSIMPTIMSSGAGAMVGGAVGGILGSVIAPGVGTAVGAGIGSKVGMTVFGGATLVQGLTGVKIPVINELLEGLDIGETITKQAQGYIGAVASETKKRLEDNPTLGLFETIGEIMQDPDNKYLWDVAKYSYGVSADLGFDDTVNFIRNIGAKYSDEYLGTNFGQRELEERSRANLGRSGTDIVDEEAMGYNALLNTWTPIFTGLVEAAMQTGMTEKQAKEFAHRNMEEYVFNYMGTSGMATDFVVGSVVDPSNFIPFVQGKAAEGIGKLTGDKALEAAGKAAPGNLLIDALPPGIQQIVETVTGKHGSQGIDTIIGQYGNNLRARNVDTLSGVQKAIAGIDSEGKIAGIYEPNTKTGNYVKDWFSNLFKKTEETKMYEMSQLTTEFVGTLLFEGKIKLDEVPDIIAQLTGYADITDTSPVKQYENSAIMNTLREGLHSAPEGVITNVLTDVYNFAKFDTNRAVLDTVSSELHMTPKEIFDAMDNKKNGADVPQVEKNKRGKNKKTKADDSSRQELYKKIRDQKITYTNADGTVMDTEAVIKSIDKFRGNRQQYSETYMRANVLEKLGRAVDDYNLKQFNIEPDRWWVRMSDLTKSMQSIALLNFSPSYMVNNFLNNLLTRSVNGVGGIDSDFVKTFNAERGLFFSRGEDVAGNYKQTHKTINKNKKAKDFLQKFDDLYTQATDKAIFKGVNNFDIEGAETRAASDLGMKRYWDATWPVNIPDLPDILDSLGIDDTTKARIIDLAKESPNLEAFINKGMGEVSIPKAKTVIDHMIDANYPDSEWKMIMQDTFSKMPWIEEDLDRIMALDDTTKVHGLMDALRDKYTNRGSMKDVVQQQSSFADYRTRFAFEGLSAISEAMDDVFSDFNDLWINQTKSNGTLFLDRVVKGLPTEEFDERFLAQMNLMTGDYNVVRNKAVKMVSAMVEGLGLDDDIQVQAIGNVMKRFDIAREQIQARHDVYQKYGRKTGNPDYDFKYYRRASLDLTQKALDAQLQADIELNDMMMRHLRGTLPDDMAGQIDIYENMQKTIIDKKRKLNAKEMKYLEKRIDTDYKKPRTKVSLLQEKDIRNKKAEISNMQHQAALKLKDLDNAIRTDPSVISPMTLEGTLSLILNIDEAKQGSERASEFLKHYVDNSNPQRVFDPIDYKNKEVNTSFRDYAKSQITNASDQTVLQNLYNSGEAVPLGAADTKHSTYTSVSDKFTPLNPKANVTRSEYMQVKCEPMATTNGVAEAGVYHNGKLIGYIVEGMPEVVNARGNDFPVIGLSTDAPDTWLVLVNDKIMKVTPGNPENAEYTSFAKENFHPGNPGSTPTIMPTGDIWRQSSGPIREAFDLLEQQAIDELQNARTNGSLLGKMTPEQREAVLNWANNDLRSAYSMQRYQTQAYGDMMVDMSLLNYSNRYGFDNALTMLMPYQFWMTRSIVNWSRRMISQPKWFSAYARTEKLIDRNKKDVMPSRLEGKVAIPMPNMGDGMGSSLYIDPLNLLFPFKQFYDMPDYFTGNLNTIHNNTLTVIDEYYSEGKPLDGHIITEEEYDQAMEARGDLYWKVYKEQQKLDETDTSMTGLVTTFLQPSVAVDAIIKKMKGKDASISQSPMYRLGNTIKATGDRTVAQPVTDLIGNALQLPDKAFRKALNIETNPEGNYYDYYMTNLITDMWIDHEISYDEMDRALYEGPGNKIYDEALYRLHQQNAIRQQGGALATEIGQSLSGNKETSAQQLLNMAIVSIFGGKTISSGEEAYREMKNTKNFVKKYGSDELASQFYKEFPEYSVHNWSYEDDPDARIHKMLVSKVWATYNALPDSQKTAVSIALGDRFNELFLTKETRATDYIPDEELGDWIRAMNGDDPTFTDADINNPTRQAYEVKWYADSVQGALDRFNRDFEKLFPGFKEAEQGYYIVPETMRTQYLKDNPVVQQGWDYKEAATRANPELAVYLNDRSAQYKTSTDQYDDITAALKSKLTSWVRGQLEKYINNGWAMKPDAEDALKKTYASLHVNIPYEEWLKNVMKEQ